MSKENKILTAVVVFLLAGTAIAARNVNIVGCNGLRTGLVDCSSTTATMVAPVSTQHRMRKGIAIYNNSSNIVYVGSFTYSTIYSTWTTIMRDKMYPIAAGTEFNDNVEPYNGAFYVLAGTDTVVSATSEVRVIEKYSNR